MEPQIHMSNSYSLSNIIEDRLLKNNNTNKKGFVLRTGHEPNHIMFKVCGKYHEYTKSRHSISFTGLSLKFHLGHLGNVERSSDNKEEQKFAKIQPTG